MYSHEVQELLNYKNHEITLEDFCNIYDSSQVRTVLLDVDTGMVEVWTDDNWEFKFWVNYKG